MIHSPRFTIILDACVLYPAPIRDILLSLAAEGLFKPKWTKKIHDEWVSSLLSKRKDLKKTYLNKTVKTMNLAFPDSEVKNYQKLIPSLELPDPDDRHVLAAAIRCNADAITTFNLKDFPSKIVNDFDIEVQHPDKLVSNLFELNEELACLALNKMIKRLKNPPLTKEEVTDKLIECGLKKSGIILKNNC